MSSKKVNIIGSDSGVQNISFSVDENNIIGGAGEILKFIRPTWDHENIKFKLFTDGITNKLVGCFHVSKVDSNNLSDSSQSKRQEDVVLIRIYGNKTDLLIDRKAETKNIQLLHSHHLAPSLYAVFQNGLAYEYVPGTTLTPNTIINPNIWPLIAQQMARMHKVINHIDSNQREPMLWSKMQQFFDLVPDQFSDPVKHERVKDQFLPVQRLRNDFTELYKTLQKLNSPIVFAHNDLLLGNVIYTESQTKVTFIDYEYAAPNYQGFDIGNHFTEFAGIDQVDYTRYPSKEFQFKWLRVYLETYKDSASSVTDNDIHQLYVQANQFALASHFLWAVWALIQAEHSSIDFDFVLFAQTRYNEYLAKKKAFLSLDLNMVR